MGKLNSDGSPFFEGWIQDLGGNSGPVVFESNRINYQLEEDVVFRCKKYAVKREAPGGKASLRTATASDYDNILDLRFQNYFDGHYNKISSYQAFGQQFDENHVTVVVEVGELIVGHLYIRLDRDRGAAFLDDLFVEHSYRKRGYATALLAAGEAAVKQAGYSCIGLTSIGVRESVEFNHHFYLRRGYKLVQASDEVIEDWTRVDMKKVLRPFPSSK